MSDALTMRKKETVLTRRQFLRGLGLSTLGTGLLVLLGGVWRYLLPNASPEPSPLVKVGPLESFALNRPVFFPAQRLFVVRRPQGLQALSAMCTHLGCLVRWDETSDTFLCPCHGGRFDADGACLDGPPPRPLPSYEVFLSTDGQLVVDTAQVKSKQ